MCGTHTRTHIHAHTKINKYALTHFEKETTNKAREHVVGMGVHMLTVHSALVEQKGSGYRQLPGNPIATSFFYFRKKIDAHE